MPAWTQAFESAMKEQSMKRQAAGAPPPPSPEYIAYTNAPEILAITGSFFAVAAVVVLLRCYVRIAMLKVFGIDDYIMVFAMVCWKLLATSGL